jgi:hypothetical protein
MAWPLPNSPKKQKKGTIYIYKGLLGGSPHNVLLVFFRFYIEHDLRKNKIAIPFFYHHINFIS